MEIPGFKAKAALYKEGKDYSAISRSKNHYVGVIQNSRIIPMNCFDDVGWCTEMFGDIGWCIEAVAELC